MFRGTFTVKADEKGRIKLPALVKDRLDKEYGKGATYFVTSPTGDIVHIYPDSVWERFESILSQAPSFDETKKRFLFWASHYGGEATMDDQGRLLIPAKLRDQAGMKGEVMLAWESNHIEVRSQARYEAALEEMKLRPEDFQYLAKLGI